MLKIDEDKQDGLVVLQLEGRLDTATAADLDFAAEAYVDEPTRLVVDLGKVAYVSSAGLRVFLMMAKKLQKSEGKLVLCGMSPSVREVFDIAGFSRMLQIEDDQAAARAALG